MAKRIRKQCIICGKHFATSSLKKETCSKQCRFVLREQRKIENQQEQLCWRCGNASGSCPWSHNLTPVPGWNAEEVLVKENNGYTFRTYKIKSCPQYIYG